MKTKMNLQTIANKAIEENLRESELNSLMNESNLNKDERMAVRMLIVNYFLSQK